MRIHLNVGHLSHKPQHYLAVVLLVISNIFLLSLIPSVAKANTDSPAAVSPASTQIYDGSNAVAGGLFEVAQDFGRAMSGLSAGASSATQNVASAIANTGQAIGSVARKSVLAIAHGTADGIAYIVRLPGNLAQSTTSTAVVGGVIRPTNTAPVPVIDDSSLLATQTSATKATPEPAATDNHAEAIWPIHGTITTLFGVPHWPYQPTHSGLDISDGRPAGSTPIHPYRPGKVIDTIYSTYGLGNHVIVDHGNGITSVYGHLASISVQVGQLVNKATALGTEGSTGASTGTHLHFEIRVNGLAVDPRPHIQQPL